VSQDTVLRDDEGSTWSLDNLCTQHFLEGQAPGAEAAGAYLNEVAVELFRNGKDAEAVVIRELAKKMIAVLVPKLKAKAAEHRVDYPSGPFK
jgi:UPF0288 family protein (methanogenesis marker protein 3)